MRVMLLDTDILEPQIIETEGGLKEWYRLLRCDSIDIASRKIGGRYYDLIIDDEGLQKSRVKITALDKEQQPVLVGNLIICNYDGDGGETSLTDEDIENITSQLLILTEANAEQPEKWLAISNVEY